jgi:hypothetical protein
MLRAKEADKPLRSLRFDIFVHLITGREHRSASGGKNSTIGLAWKKQESPSFSSQKKKSICSSHPHIPIL